MRCLLLIFIDGVVIMYAIRRGIFETNSSSIHAISIPRKADIKNIPKSLKFFRQSFGWEVAIYSSLSDKLSYLYEMIFSSSYGAYHLSKLMKFLDKKGIDYTFPDPDCASYDGDMEFYEFDPESGNIDHGSSWGYDLDSFLNKLLNDDDLLSRYLFSHDTYIYTGNDNSEGDYPSYDRGLDYESFVKYN